MTDTLIDAVLAATGPSRLDYVRLFAHIADDLDLPPDHDFRRHLSQAIRSGSDDRAHRYLLCAAMTLGDMDMLCHSRHPDMGGKQWIATVGKCRAQAHTPALAILAAALRARR